MIDDYGHHPTEIRATLAAARACRYRRIHVLFQPHRHPYAGADGRFRQRVPSGRYRSSGRYLCGIGAAHRGRDRRRSPSVCKPSVTAARRTPEAWSRYRIRSEAADAGDAIVTLGAGNVSQAGSVIVERLRSKRSVGRKSYEGTGVLPGLEDDVRPAPPANRASKNRRTRRHSAFFDAAPYRDVLHRGNFPWAGPLRFHRLEQFLIMDSRLHSAARAMDLRSKSTARPTLPARSRKSSRRYRRQRLLDSSGRAARCHPRRAWVREASVARVWPTE